MVKLNVYNYNKQNYYIILVIIVNVEMTILVKSELTKRCPFSKKLIYPKTLLCVFTKYQYEKFVTYINFIFLKILPPEIIAIIIRFTNYEKQIQRMGLIAYTNWSTQSKLRHLQAFTSDESSDSESSDDESHD